ncbi:MAG TPA: radical SAM protein [Methylomirabilota bacterium]|nr:radical SAM protein [Methylomirabilota bacterium]
MSSRMSLPLVVHEPGAGHAPVVPFLRLSALWIQITGTWCNLECTHCINASGPDEPWLKPIAPEVARAAMREADELGVKEIYFTGGEPFLHGEILALLADALVVAPTTVLTNGTLIDEAMADRLAALARAAAYSLEIRVSLDDTDPEKNDRVRGAGAFNKAVRAIQLLHERGLLPIVTATEITSHEHAGGRGMYERFRGFLAGLGIEKPRVKILPVFALGRLSREGGRRLTEEDLEGFERGTLQCSESRVVADGGVYACPILAGLPGAKLSDGGLEASFRDAPLYHPSCVTCHETGMTCKNG